jgi:hypothetical protein
MEDPFLAPRGGAARSEKALQPDWIGSWEWGTPNGLKFFAFWLRIFKLPSPITSHSSHTQTNSSDRAEAVDICPARSVGTATGCESRKRDEASKFAQPSLHARQDGGAFIASSSWNGGLCHWPDWHGRHGQDVCPETQQRRMEVIIAVFLSDPSAASSGQCPTNRSCVRPARILFW